MKHHTSYCEGKVLSLDIFGHYSKGNYFGLQLVQLRHLSTAWPGRSPLPGGREVAWKSLTNSHWTTSISLNKKKMIIKDTQSAHLTWGGIGGATGMWEPTGWKPNSSATYSTLTWLSWWLMILTTISKSDAASLNYCYCRSGVALVMHCVFENLLWKELTKTVYMKVQIKVVTSSPSGLV